jgi:hypothetical protein
VIVAIDPGIRGCGIAVFRDDATLLRADHIKSRQTSGNDAAACVAMALSVRFWLSSNAVLADGGHTLVLEWPRIIPASRQRAEKRHVDPNDLLALVGVDCAIAMSYRDLMTLMTVYPDEWKGQTPKKVMNARVWERLSPDEKASVNSPSNHNTLDAVGLGLHQLGRMAPRRVYG